MTQTYSTETIANQLATLGLPFTDLLARALTALLSGRKATVHQITTLLPGPQAQKAQSAQAKRPREAGKFLGQPGRFFRTQAPACRATISRWYTLPDS